MDKKWDKKCLQVFAKTPIKGQVKTRLIADLGEEGAYEAYKQLLEKSLTLATQSIYQTELWCHPNQQHTYFKQAASKHTLNLHDQCGDDLGERMHFAMQNALQTKEAVVLMGCDCPALTKDYINLAFEALQLADVVLGPAEDGGFVLIGCKKTAPLMFKEVTWGESSVLDSTLVSLQQCGLTHHLLPTLWDVDILSDYQRWQAI